MYLWFLSFPTTDYLSGRCFRREVLSFGTFDLGMLFHWSAVEKNTTKWVFESLPSYVTREMLSPQTDLKKKQTSFIRRHQCKRMIVFSLFSFYLDNFCSSLSAIISSWTSSQPTQDSASEVFSWIWHASVLRQIVTCKVLKGSLRSARTKLKDFELADCFFVSNFSAPRKSL